MEITNLNSIINPEKISSTNDFIKTQVLNNFDIQNGRILHKSLKIPYLKINLPHLDIKDSLNEAFNLNDLFVEHRGNDSNGWSSLCLHGIDPFKTRHCEFYGYENELETPYKYTTISQNCPTTTEWIKSLVQLNYFDKLFRVRFMRLNPGGYIKFHWDRPPGNNSLGPVNFALNMPDNCHWLFKDWGPVPFSAGDAFAVDVSNHHGVWNLSNQPRIHIIIHGRYGEKYYEALASGKNDLIAFYKNNSRV